MSRAFEGRGRRARGLAFDHNGHSCCGKGGGDATCMGTVQKRA